MGRPFSYIGPTKVRASLRLSCQHSARTPASGRGAEILRWQAFARDRLHFLRMTVRASCRKAPPSRNRTREGRATRLCREGKAWATYCLTSGPRRSGPACQHGARTSASGRGAEILRWQAFASRRLAVPQDDSRGVVAKSPAFSQQNARRTGHPPSHAGKG